MKSVKAKVDVKIWEDGHKFIMTLSSSQARIQVHNNTWSVVGANMLNQFAAALEHDS